MPPPMTRSTARPTWSTPCPSGSSRTATRCPSMPATRGNRWKTAGCPSSSPTGSTTTSRSGSAPRPSPCGVRPTRRAWRARWPGRSSTSPTAARSPATLPSSPPKPATTRIRGGSSPTATASCWKTAAPARRPASRPASRSTSSRPLRAITNWTARSTAPTRRRCSARAGSITPC